MSNVNFRIIARDFRQTDLGVTQVLFAGQWRTVAEIYSLLSVGPKSNVEIEILDMREAVDDTYVQVGQGWHKWSELVDDLEGADGGGSGSLASVADYAALRAMTTDHSLVVVSDSSTAGLFRRNDAAGADDNCLTIVRTDGAKYERVWDGENFYVEWIPLGTTFSGPHYGPSTIANNYNGDKIVAASEIAGPRAKLHLKPETTYNVSHRLYQRGQTIIGNDATIRRGDQISSTVTVQAEIGATSLTVADASGFRVGDRIFAVITPGALGGHAMIATHGSAGFNVTSIVGNTINFAGQPLVKQVIVGKKVVVLNYMFSGNGVTNQKFRIQNCTIDGNAAAHADVVDWAAGGAVSNYWQDVHDVKFINHPNECVILGSGRITDCEFQDCLGSLVHTTNFTGTKKKGVLVQNCHGQNVATVDNGHDEGAITFSADSQHVRVVDCIFDNSAGTTGQGVFGLASGVTGDLDDHFFARNVVARNFNTIINVAVNASSIPIERITIKDSEFYDCGYMSVGTSGQTQTKSVHVKRFDCKGNKFVNCWFSLKNIHNLEWDNHCTWDFGYTGVFTGSKGTFAALPTTRIGGTALADGDWCHLYNTDGGNLFGNYVRTSGVWVYDVVQSAQRPRPGTSIPAGMTIERCGRVRIRGLFQGPECSWRAALLNGIYLNPVQTLVLESGATSTSYMTDVQLDGVQVLSWTYCIVSDVATGPWAATAAQDVSGWRFDNLLIAPRRESTVFGPTVIGMEVLAGCVATNCRVMLPETGTSASSHGILLKGPVTNSTTVGGVAVGCYVPYAPGSAQALRFGQTSANVRNNNCIAKGNLLAKAAIQNGAGVNIDADNTVVSSVLLTAMTAQAVIPHRPVGVNANLY